MISNSENYISRISLGHNTEQTCMSNAYTPQSLTYCKTYLIMDLELQLSNIYYIVYEQCEPETQLTICCQYFY